MFSLPTGIVGGEAVDWTPPVVPAGETGPILISGEAELATAAATYGWSGDGSAGDPFVIEGLDVNGSGSQYCLKLGSLSSSHVVVRDCRFFGTNNTGSGPRNGVILTDCHNVTMFNNTVEDHRDTGISSLNSNVWFFNNTIRHNDDGLTVEGGSNNIEANVLDGNEIGIRLEGDSTADGNVINGGNGGIYIQRVTPKSVSNNTFTNMGTGIRIGVGCGPDTKYEHNIFQNCHIGISVNYRRITLAYNTMTDCPGGINLCSLNTTLVGNELSGSAITFDGISCSRDGARSHTILASNTVGGRPVQYLINTHDVTIRPDLYGEVILADCYNVSLEHLAITEEFWLLLLTCANVTIEGNHVDMGMAAKWVVLMTYDVRIAENTINDVDLDFLATTMMDISRNTLDGGWVRVVGTVEVTIRNNTIRTYGETALTLDLWDQKGVTVLSNNITVIDPAVGNYTVAMRADGAYLDLRHNTLRGVGINDDWLPTSVKGSNYRLDTSNTLNGRPILYLDRVSGMRINEGYGQVLVCNSSGITVEDLVFIDGDGGITMVETEGLDIAGCTFDRLLNGAIHLVSCNDTDIKDCLFTGRNSIVRLYRCNREGDPRPGNITGNYFVDLAPDPMSRAALRLEESSLHSMNGNLISNVSGTGIHAYSGATTLAQGNEIARCTRWAYNGNLSGVQWDHNSFVDNGLYRGSQVAFASTTDQWDNGSEGNYWSNYEDRYPDATNDGTVWDTPYVVYYTRAVDRYPLVLYADRIAPIVRLVCNNITSTGKLEAFDAVAVDNVGVTRYDWSFDGGATWSNGAGHPVGHTFGASGDFTVTVRVWDAAGNTAQDSRVVHVLDNLPPVAVAGDDVTVVPGTTVRFDGSASHDDASIALYKWTFQYDGQPVQLTGAKPQFRFDLQGVYAVTLTVLDPAGNGGQDVMVVTVGDEEPPVAVAGEDTEVPKGTRLVLSGLNSTDNWRIDGWDWNVTSPGGGVARYTTAVATHTFREVGVHVVTLRVTDPVGLWDEASFRVTVLDLTAPVAVAGGDVEVSQDEPVRLDGSASSDDEGVVSWEWELDGPGGYHETLSGAAVTVTFADAGVYTATLTVADAAGNSASASITVTVWDIEPPVARAGFDVAVDEGDAVKFDGSASTDNVRIAAYNWSFHYGGGTQRLEGPTPEFTFDLAGVYTVTLTVTDLGGNSANDDVVVTVRDATAPVAVAGPDVTVDQHTAVTFDGSRSTDNVGIAAFLWVLQYGGERRELSGATPGFTFDLAGVYAVNLTVSDAAGNAAWDALTVTVLDTEPPVADAGSDVTIDEGETFRFDGSASTDNVGVVSWRWVFDVDGTDVTLEGETADHAFDRQGTYTVTLEVADGRGNSAQDTMVVTVRAPVDGGPEGGWEPSVAVVGVALAVVVAAVVSAVVLWQRRR